MTLESANKMVANLLDEETPEEFEHKLPAFYDYAQKQIATTVDYIKTMTHITVESETEIDIGEYVNSESDKNVYAVRRIIPSDNVTKLYDKTYKLPAGEYRVICDVYPQTITADTPPDYEFEISPEAQPALVYYAAAQSQTMESDLRPRSAFMDMYNNILQNISDAKREGVSLNVIKLGGNYGV